MRVRTVALVGLLAVALTLSGVAATGTTQTDGSATLNQSTFADQRGDVVRVGIQLSNADEATVTVGDVGQNNWVQNVTVRDGDGDGAVTLTINTYTAGTSDDGNTVYGVASDGDSVENVATAAGPFDPSTPNEMTLAADDYALAVVAGATPATSADADDTATLSLGERSTDALEIHVAPDNRRDDIDSVDSIVSLQASDNVTAASSIAAEDILLARLDADGLQGVLRHELDSGAATVTDAFFRATNDESATPVWHVNVTQMNPGANADAETLRLNRTNTVLFDDPSTGTYWLRIDTGQVEMETQALSDGDEFESNVTVAPTSGLTTDTETVLDSWTFTDPDATVDTNADIDDDGSIDEVTVQQASGQYISGTANVAPGTELGVRITGTDAGSPFVKPLTAIVQPDGTWTTVADFSGNAQGANFTIDVSRGSVSLLPENVDGAITDAPTASVTFNDQESAGSTLAVWSVTLSDGGFVALHRDNASGTVIGTSEYIESGSDSDVQISLDSTLGEDTTVVAMPHQDTDGDQSYEFEFGSPVDAPYTENGSAVTDSADVTVTSPTVHRENLSVTITGTNAPITAGETLDVTADIENVGDANGTQQVTLSNDTGTVDQQSVSLSAGETTTTTLSWGTDASSDGEQTVTVASDNDTASQTVTVEGATASPVADDDSYTGWINETVVVDAPGVLGNDTVADGDTPSASLVDGPDNGSLTLYGNGSFVYTPDSGVTGTDSFTYEVSDGDGGTDTATVTLSVSRPTFAVTDVSSNATIEAGEQLGVTVTVENRGGVADSQSLALRTPDGTTVDSATVSLEPNASTTVTLVWNTTADDVLNDAVTIATTTNTTTHALVVESATDDSGDTNNSEDDSENNQSRTETGTESVTATPVSATATESTEGRQSSVTQTAATATSETATNATASTETATGGSGPGVGPWATLVVVVATVAYARRRG